MSHIPMCFWCDKKEIGSEIASDAFCSNACLDEWTAIQNLELSAEDDDFEDEDYDEDEDEDAEDEYDGQPDEMQEWHDFDPNC